MNPDSTIPFAAIIAIASVFLIALVAFGVAIWRAHKAEQQYQRQAVLRKKAREALAQNPPVVTDVYQGAVARNTRGPGAVVTPMPPRRSQVSVPKPAPSPRAYGENPPPAPRREAMSPTHAAPYTSSPNPSPTPPSDYYASFVTGSAYRDNTPAPSPSYDCSSDSSSSSSSSSDSSSSCGSGD